MVAKAQRLGEQTQIVLLAPAPDTAQSLNGSIVSHDWSRSPLGPLSHWPPALRIAVDMLQLSPFPCAVVWGPELCVVQNDAYPIRGLQGRCFHDLWEAADPPMGAALFKALEGHGSYVEAVRLPGSGEGPFACYYSPLRDDYGSVAGFLHTVIAASVDAELTREWRERAQSFEAQLASYLANSEYTWQLSPDVMLMLDSQQCLRLANPSGQRLLGWSEPTSPVDSASLLALLHPADCTEALLALIALGKQGGASTFEARIRHVDGHYCWFSWTTVSGQAMPMLVGRDISQQRQAVQQLAEAALRDSSRLESAIKLAGGMGHEMNNVLSGVGSSLELLERRLLQGRQENLEYYVKLARECAERAIGLTHNLLAFARSQPLSPTPLDINQLLRDAQSLLRQSLGSEIQLDWQLDTELWPVQLDADQLRNSLLHLCANAHEACLGRGRVSIRSTNERLTTVQEGRSSLPAGDYVAIQVEDDGHGMSAEDLRQAFEPFFTTKALGRGSGLGLPMVHGFVRQSGGHVWIESVQGQGTRVMMMFPRYPGSLPEPQMPDLEPFAVQGERLLLIDDEVSLRRLMKEALLDRGYAVDDASDANTGMGHFRVGGPFDLVITDIGLPDGFNGRQAARAMRMLEPGQKVLFITGYTEEQIEPPMLAEQGVALLYKPFTLEALCQQVKRMLHG
ncbi:MULTISPECIES: ATP-binding protein [unclassified Pseudomonas]|uniref:ATP-binding protein n=1 Tax=Pseudomonas sp. NY15463 TaxID=3400361 RepID=UPI003A848CFF